MTTSGPTVQDLIKTTSLFSSNIHIEYGLDIIRAMEDGKYKYGFPTIPMD